jgi:glycosyltransferase involved in cell wall biosynthesis
MTRLGHEVTVFATAGSQTCGELVATLPGPYATAGSPGDWHLCEWINLARAVEQSRRFDVMHSHAYLWGMPLAPLAHAPMVHTTHLCPDADAARLWSMTPDACVTAISRFQWSAFPHLRPAAVIHHGVDEGGFTFRPEPEDYACYLGRFTPGKGPVAAVAAARTLGLRLLMAGPSNAYFEREVRPLVDGRQVEYLGPVGGAKRDQLLGGARVLLYPLTEPEPFGLVAAEAMTCGTPVAAVRVGAVEEVLDEGVTGCSASTAEGFAEAVVRALGLDRRRVRRRAEERFSARRMAEEYLGVYERLVRGGRPS